MEITREKIGLAVIIRVKGILKLSESGRRFSEFMHDCLTNEKGPVLMDLSEVDELDSNGIGELVGYLQRFEKAGRILGVLHPSPRIRKLLSFTKLELVFPVFEDLDSALCALEVHR